MLPEPGRLTHSVSVAAMTGASELISLSLVLSVSQNAVPDLGTGDPPMHC